jgi:hypothetical protein
MEDWRQLMEDWIIDGVRYTTEPTELCYDDLKALSDKRLELLKEYKILLMMIINQRKASVGGLENTYMPQLNREYIDKSCAELEEAIAEE